MQTLIGVFNSRYEADRAIQMFEEKGFNPKDISVITKNGHTQRSEQTGVKGGRAAQGAATGAAAGGILGGLAGILVGIGAIAIPGVGAFLVAGPLAAALGLTGAAATTVSGAAAGILAGGLVGALVSLGIPEQDARMYEERIREGAILLAVPARESQDVSYIRSVFETYGAEQIRTIDNYSD